MTGSKAKGYMTGSKAKGYMTGSKAKNNRKGEACQKYQNSTERSSEEELRDMGERIPTSCAHLTYIDSL